VLVIGIGRQTPPGSAYVLILAEVGKVAHVARRLAMWTVRS
jgi:hypothetical protein